MKNKPHFVIVGAAKSGTTTLYRHLQKHPGIFLPDFKEPHYFASHHPLNFEHIDSADDYYRLFSSAYNKICGEASTAYLYFEDAPERIHKELPNCKIIAILRDPTERALSMWGHQIREGLEESTLEEALDQELSEGIRQNQGVEYGFNYHKLGHVSHILERYISLFGRQNVLLIDYRTLRENPEALMNDVHHFLGVECLPLQQDNTRFNASGKPKSALLHRFLNSKHPLRKLIVSPLRLILPAHKRQALWQRLRNQNILNGQRHQLNSKTKLRLDTLFKDEINKLQALIAS